MLHRLDTKYININKYIYIYNYIKYILEYSSVVQYFVGHNKTQLSYHTYLNLGLEKKGLLKRKRETFISLYLFSYFFLEVRGAVRSAVSVFSTDSMALTALVVERPRRSCASKEAVASARRELPRFSTFSTAPAA